MKKQSLYAILLAAVTMIVANSAQAQSAQSGDLYRSEPAEFNFLWSQAKPSRSAFRLMPAGTYSNSAHSRFSLTASTNSVTGSGSAGRIAKWIGVMGSNTFVLGNSSIYEDKFGKVGIGTTTPTSPLTVAGLIESTSGGFKFPDGTLQTSAGLTSIPIPLNLVDNFPDFILTVSNTGTGEGVQIFGGNNMSQGGRGILAFGGSSISGSGGAGAAFRGGDSNSGSGGLGMTARGGDSNSNEGGLGVFASGGNSSSNEGGLGMHAVGGIGAGTGNSGGVGIAAFGGLGVGGATDGLAGFFQGDVQVTGMLSKGGGSFKIDHPLDPENRYLYHSFVESPDMMNIYNGVAKLDQNGEVVVEMPEWFSALNRDFRYLLTPMGAPMPGLYIAEELTNNCFRIAGGAPSMKISWQITGIRQDGWANRNRIQVEVEKTDRERGYYLHPEAFDQPEELGVEWARNPELMKQRKEARERARQKQR